MAEVLTVIGLLSAAIGGVERATKIIEGIRGAPRAIAKLDSELKVISELLYQIQKRTFCSSSQDFITQLRTTLAGCEDVASEVETLLKPYAKPGRSTWRRITWTFKEKKIADLEKEMAR